MLSEAGGIPFPLASKSSYFWERRGKLSSLNGLSIVHRLFKYSMRGCEITLICLYFIKNTFGSRGEEHRLELLVELRGRGQRVLVRCPTQEVGGELVEGAGELGLGAGVRAEAVRDRVDLFLQVGLEVLGDVVDQEVDVPREVVVHFDDALDGVVCDFVAPAHVHVVDQGRGEPGGLHETASGEADLFVHGDGKLHGHVEVLQQARKEGRGGDKGLVGDGHAAQVRRCAVLVLHGVVPILHVALMHPVEDLFVEGAVVEGLLQVERTRGSPAGGLAGVVLFERHVERGDGAESG